MNRTRSARAATAAVTAALAAVVSLPGCLSACGPVDQARPNIVLIIIDTLRADKMSAYGYPQPTSPEIDRLADRGVRFATAVAQSSWTRPSIGSMLTSLYPRTIGIYQEKHHALNERFDTLAEVLKDGGYTTVGATANPNINSVFSFQQGFDHYVNSDTLWTWMDPEPGKKTTAKSSLPTSREVLDSMTAWVGENGAPPYYVQVNLMEVHESLKKDVLARIDTSLFTAEPNASYLQALRHVSGAIGRFVDHLSQQPGWENTLYVITSDHGQGLDSHPDVPWSKGHGTLLYESQVLVPLIFYNPAGDLPAGRVVEDRVRLLDLMPTLLAYAGVSPTATMDGVSVLTLLHDGGDAAPLPENFVVETEFKKANKIGVYTPEWKYFKNRDGHAGTNRLALQRFGVVENGRKTDVGHEFPDVVQRLAVGLYEWESAHPRISPTIRRRELSPAEVEQLRSLGYID